MFCLIFIAISICLQRTVEVEKLISGGSSFEWIVFIVLWPFKSDIYGPSSVKISSTSKTNLKHFKKNSITSKPIHISIHPKQRQNAIIEYLEAEPIVSHAVACAAAPCASMCAHCTALINYMRSSSFKTVDGTFLRAPPQAKHTFLLSTETCSSRVHLTKSAAAREAIVLFAIISCATSAIRVISMWNGGSIKCLCMQSHCSHECNHGYHAVTCRL